MEGEKKVDLHVHTNQCDGATPDEVVTAARDMAVAICDHWAVEGIYDIIETARVREVNLEVVPCIELSTMEGFDILGFLIDPKHKPLLDEIARVREGRYKREMQVADNLGCFFDEHRIGLSAKFEGVLKYTRNNNIAGGHFERHIYDQLKDMAANDREKYEWTMQSLIVAINNEYHTNFAFDARLDVNAPYFVKFVKEELVRKYLLGRQAEWFVPRTLDDCLAAEHAINLVIDAGGEPGIAHPGGTDNDAMIPTLVQMGATVLEVFSTKHKSEQNGYYSQMAIDLGLKPSGGSDWHGPLYSPHLMIGCYVPRNDPNCEAACIPYSILEGIREINKKRHSANTAGLQKNP